MTTTPSPPEEEPLEEVLLVEVPSARSRLVGAIPRLPNSRAPRPNLTEDLPPPTSPRPPPGGPRATVGGPSSTGSTEPPLAVVETVDPKDFREAVRDAVDIGFVLIGQGVGKAHASRTGRPRDASRWQPTVTERRRVVNPAHRIARRHIVNSKDTMDAVDIALMAAGVGSYMNRALFELPELEELEDDDDDA